MAAVSVKRSISSLLKTERLEAAELNDSSSDYFGPCFSPLLTVILQWPS